uniref:Protein kinase domain-containing protein n=1 Tax=Cucumis sativus TaxID=3659 RepID=A0A0A0K3Q1_CUCSA
MGWKRSSRNGNLRIWVQVLVGFVVCAAQVLLGITNPGDFSAISSLHTALGLPSLPGWGIGQDPCGDAWQGVVCNDSSIIRIIINAANLGGELGDNLGLFSSIQTIDLSNNHIGGSIPSNLPVTLQNFFLSANQFTGSIPSSLSSLTQLTAMSLNDNKLSGEIPDSFQVISQLVNFDLSNNNLSGPLPPSVSNLLALTTLHLQNNQLSGTLDVLQDLPLKDLNIENNLFSGPIPEKVLSIPNFRKDGNPFNSSVSPTSPPVSPSPPSKPAPAPPVSGGPPVSGAPPSSQQRPKKQADGPSASEESSSGKNKKSTKRVVLITIAVVLSFIILVLACVLFMPRCRRRRRSDSVSKRHQIGAYRGERENVGNQGAMPQTNDQIPKVVPKEPVVRMKQETQTEVQKVPKDNVEREKNMPRMSAIPKKDHHEVDMSTLDVYLMPPPPPPPPPPVEEVTAVPTVPAEVPPLKPLTKNKITLPFARPYTIASLQQYTNSFSQENLLGEGMLGNVYRAHLPSGKVLAVKKLDKRAFSLQKDDEFLELVNNIDRIRHANVVELSGYCAEHGERLLIFEYCSGGTLQDALHSDEEFRKKLSWNARIRMALGAARALEYLHEVCQPPVIHRNFKSANILLDDDLSVRVSDCGLAPLISKGAVSQLSGQLLTAYGYGAPEFESGVYTLESDVYSFGVVMLELLTGRMSYDRTRIRGEQFLVRWAIPQLHDIEALTSMVDPSLNGRYPAKSLSYFADIISKCVQSEPEFRPPMSSVVQDLLNMIRREPQGSGSSEG